MLRQTMLGSLAAVLLAPALLVGGTAAPASAAPKRHEWGRITAPDGVLRPGCHRYTYTYDLHPPTGDWAVEVFVIHNGQKVTSQGHLVGQDPLRGQGRYKLCRPTSTPGSWRIRGKLSVQNGPDEYAEGWIQPAFYRLRGKR